MPLEFVLYIIMFMNIDNLRGKWVDAHFLFASETSRSINNDAKIAERRVQRIALERLKAAPTSLDTP